MSSSLVLAPVIDFKFVVCCIFELRTAAAGVKLIVCLLSTSEACAWIRVTALLDDT